MMSGDLTQNLPPRPFEERVLAELAAIRGGLNRLDSRLAALEERVDRLEEKVDRRLQETRPIWEDVQSRLQKLATKFDLVIHDLYEVRQDQAILLRRVDQLERQRAE